MDRRNERANEALRRKEGLTPKLTVEHPVVQSPETRALNAFIRRSIGRAEMEALEGRAGETKGD